VTEPDSQWAAYRRAFDDRLRDARLQANDTQEGLEERAGVSRDTVQRVERGDGEIPQPSGLPYQALRTYTDGLWTADRLPPVRVLAALSEAVGPTDVQRAVRETMAARADDAAGPPSLTWGQRVVLEAVRGFDDDLLVVAAPRVHDLLAEFVTEQ